MYTLPEEIVVEDLDLVALLDASTTTLNNFPPPPEEINFVL